MSRKLLAIRILFILIVIAFSLTGISAFAQSAAVVRVDPPTLSAQVNDTVNISIKVDNIANLTAFELHLSFNPSVLEVLQVTNGGFVLADITPQNTFNNTAGTIDYAVAQLNRPAAQGSGTLLNISFRAKASGISTVALRGTAAVPSGFLLSDLNGISIQASWTGGSVNVGGSPTQTFTPMVPTSTPVVPPTNTPTGPTITPVNTPTNTAIVPTNTPSATPIPIAVGGILGTHVVHSGEWLYCIGRAYRVSPLAIAEKNGIWWPYLIFSNQKLLVPNIAWTNMSTGPVCQSQFTASTTPASPTAIPTTAILTTPIPTTTAVTAIPTTTTAVPSSTCKATYTVVSGDTLYHIATQYGTSYPEIARVNQISNPTLIYPGQQLCIP